tara:strand:+ start:626 stop:1258 length:633 start_codon:yes stop_codon:yes gene_type:complete
MIVSLNPDNQSHIEAVAKLHKELLSDSPIVHLGDSFMKKIYYERLVKDRLFLCDLYYHTNTCVGFISYTNDPHNFMQKGMKKHFISLCLILVKSIVQKPVLTKTVFSVFLDIFKRKATIPSCEELSWGEVLSFGVSSDALKIVNKESGKRIPNVLFERAIEYFKKQEIKKHRLKIVKDNKAALLFYLSYGGKIIEDQHAENDNYLLEFSI